MFNRLIECLIVLLSSALGFMYFSSVENTGATLSASSSFPSKINSFLYHYENLSLFFLGLAFAGIGFLIKSKVQRRADIRDLNIRVERQLLSVVHFAYGYFRTFYEEIERFSGVDEIYSGDLDIVINEFANCLMALDLKILETVDSALLTDNQWVCLEGFVTRIKSLKDKASKIQSKSITVENKLIEVSKFLQKDFIEARCFAEKYTGLIGVYGSNTELSKECLREVSHVEDLAKSLIIKPSIMFINF